MRAILAFTHDGPYSRGYHGGNVDARNRYAPILVRHGVDHTHFARAIDDQTPIPVDLQSLPRPIIGFHGLVAEWIDHHVVRGDGGPTPGCACA